MDTTRNTLQNGLGAFEYAKLLDSADQISIFGEPVKELSKDELLAALVFTMRSNQEQTKQNANENNFTRPSSNTQGAGLW